jgi:hypothetical protein
MEKNGVDKQYKSLVNCNSRVGNGSGDTGKAGKKYSEKRC